MDQEYRTARLTAMQRFEHALRYALTVDGPDRAAEIQALFACIQNVIETRTSTDDLTWASFMLTGMPMLLTTIDEWRQWGRLAQWLLQELVLWCPDAPIQLESC